jgi:hypothetical protein
LNDGNSQAKSRVGTQLGATQKAMQKSTEFRDSDAASSTELSSNPLPEQRFYDALNNARLNDAARLDPL